MNNDTTTPAVFQFSGQEIRLVAREDGEPLFCAKDVCEVLGIQNSRDTIKKALDEDEKGVATIYTPGGEQRIGVVTESGLYALIFQSRKPEARRFRKWVTSEVLPAIRRTGGYGTLRSVDYMRLQRLRFDLVKQLSNRSDAFVRDALLAQLQYVSVRLGLTMPDVKLLGVYPEQGELPV